MQADPLRFEQGENLDRSRDRCSYPDCVFISHTTLFFKFCNPLVDFAYHVYEARCNYDERVL